MNEFTLSTGVSPTLLVSSTNNILFFTEPTTPVLRLDKDGMTYKGQRIEDAGEAHRAFMEVMTLMKERTP